MTMMDADTAEILQFFSYEHLPPHLHDLYVRAFDAALHPVFVVGAFIAGFAFALSWLLQEKPLRKTTEGLMEAV